MKRVKNLDHFEELGDAFQISEMERKVKEVTQVLDDTEKKLDKKSPRDRKNSRLFRNMINILIISSASMAGLVLKYKRENPDIESIITGVEEIDANIRQIAKDLGTGEVKRIKDLPSVQNEQERVEALKAEGQIIFENMDDILPGIKSEDVELALKTCFPKGMNIEKVHYDDKDVLMPDNYGIKTDTNGKPAIEAAHVPGHGKEIVFTKGIKQCDVNGFFQTLFHEGGHCGDINNNKFLTPDERLWLAGKLLDRLKKGGRFHSGYVEKIKNDDKRNEIKTKSCEYWAEIMSQYIIDKSTLPWDDQIIVSTIIRKIDPTFDSNKASNALQQIIRNINARNNPTYDTYTAKSYDAPITTSYENVPEAIPKAIPKAKPVHGHDFKGVKIKYK